ncbi:hypothetical protein Btru_059893 [Bulinus truncatus]|nr:hypothetical protein Btru_059893 [Bulinus truncatus]
MLIKTNARLFECCDTTLQIVFVFYNQVTQVMSDALEHLGISVVGQRVDVADDVQDKLGSVASSDAEEEDSEDGASSEDEEGTLQGRVSGPGVDAASRLSADSEKQPPAPVIPNVNLDSASGESRISDTSSHLREQPIVSGDTPPQVPSHLCGTALFLNSSTTLDPDLLGVTATCTDLSGESIEDGLPPAPAGSGHSVPQHQAPHGDLSEPHFEFSLRPSAHLSLAGPCQLKRDLFLHLVVSPPAFEVIVPGTPVFSSLRACPPIPRVNLDITSLIALVSSVTNGRCYLVFRDKVLTQQAMEERETPILPMLTDFLKGKEMFVCETALSSFKSILDILGGEKEKERAEKFLASVRVVKDEPSARSLTLDCQGRVKNRSKVIFGTGDTLQAVTVTSNMGFVRAAKSQGISFAVFLHQARALTEEKEQFAASLEN